MHKGYTHHCCCCEVTSVVSDSVRPHRRQPTRLPRPWESPGKNTAVGCHFLLQCMKVKSQSEVAQSCLTLRDSMDCSLQAPPSMGVSRQEYWSGVPLPSPTHSSRHVYFSFCPSRVKGGVRFSFSSNPSFHRHPFASSVTENNGEKPHPSFLSNIVNCTM